MEFTRLTADVVLLAPGERVLLIQRGHDPYEGLWALPGGHVDDGEPTVVAARRELLEETGLVVDGLELVGVYGAPGRDPRGRYVTFAYTALLLDGGERELCAGDDAVAARWWRVSELTPAMLAFDHHQIITDTVEQRRARFARERLERPVSAGRGQVSHAQARDAVIEAWKAGPYAARTVASIGFFDAIQMVNDAVRAVLGVAAPAPSGPGADQIPPPAVGEKRLTLCTDPARRGGDVTIATALGYRVPAADVLGAVRDLGLPEAACLWPQCTGGELDVISRLVDDIEAELTAAESVGPQ